MQREDQGDGEQPYDVHVARSLCDDKTLTGDNRYWQINILVLILTVIAIIVLCTIFEVYKNREIA